MTTPLPRLAVSIGEAASMLGFSENHFRARVLPALPVIRGTRPRIAVSDLERWIEEHRTAPAGAAGSGSAIPSTTT